MDNSIEIWLLGSYIKVNGILPVIAFTIVMLTFLALRQPSKIPWRRMFGWLWHWFDQRRSNTLPMVRDTQINITPSHPPHTFQPPTLPNLPMSHTHNQHPH